MHIAKLRVIGICHVLIIGGIEMIKMQENNQIVKEIYKVVKCNIFYDKERFILFVYAFDATKEQVQKIKNIFTSYVDRNNLQTVYERLTIYS